MNRRKATKPTRIPVFILLLNTVFCLGSAAHDAFDQRWALMGMFLAIATFSAAVLAWFEHDYRAEKQEWLHAVGGCTCAHGDDGWDA